ncbi:MAG: hypothetical protein ACI4V1_03850 [Eubacteriales bacterium]
MLNSMDFLFYHFTRALMTMSLCGCVYLLRTVVWMMESPSAALSLYHSFPALVEHIVAGLLFYAAFGLLLTKTVPCNAV